MFDGCEVLLFILGLLVSMDIFSFSIYLFLWLEFLRVYDFLVDVSNDLGYSGWDCEYGEVVVLVFIVCFGLFLLMDCV